MGSAFISNEAYRLISSAFFNLHSRDQGYLSSPDCSPSAHPCTDGICTRYCADEVLSSTQHWLQSSFSADKGIWDVLLFASPLLLTYEDILTRRWHYDFYRFSLMHNPVLYFFPGWSLSPHPSSWDSPHCGRLQASISLRHYEPSVSASFCSIAANITAQLQGNL